MASLFISYSRKNIESARKLTEAFQGQDLDFWIDWEGIPPTVDWWQEIEKGIEEADIFLFLISPDSCRSKYCKQEIEHAVKNGKRLIPLVVCDVNPEEAPAELGHLNWIFVRETDDFNLAFGKLINAIKTDYAWVQAHRELQVRALEWDKSGHENSFLLFGKALHEAEHLLATNTSKEPHPTDLQREYVHASRKAVDRRRARNTGITTAAIIALAALALFSFNRAGAAQDAQATAESNLFAAQTAQANAEHQQALANANAATAVANAKISRAGELAAQAAVLRISETGFPISLLLSVEAFQLRNTIQTRGELMNNAYEPPVPMEDLIWDPKYEYPTLSEDLPVFWPSNPVFSPDGKILFIGDMGTIALWNMETKEPFGSLQSTHEVSSIAFSLVENILAAISESGTLSLWNMENGQLVGQPIEAMKAQHTDTLVQDLAFSPDGKTLAVAGWSNTITLLNVKTQNSIVLQQPTSMLTSVAFSPNGKLLAAGGCGKTDSNQECVEGRIVLWNVESQQLIGEPLIGHGTTISSIAFHPDGKILASASYDNTIFFWNVDTHKPSGLPMNQHTRSVYSIAFSPDGKTLASGAGDESIILWDVQTHQPIGLPLVGNDVIFDIAFSPDGKKLVSSGSNHSILWDVDSSSFVKKICQYAGRNFTRLEWNQYFPNETYRKTCDQWPLESEAVATPSPMP